MAKYRNKATAFIEAFQWFPEMGAVGGVVVERGVFYLPTLRFGRIDICPGDWVIDGLGGDKYTCPNVVFEATYEPV